MQDLNTLLQKRFRSTGWTPLTAANSADALDKVLAERRKELPFTVNIRWTDLRRLNMDPVFAKTLIRRISGQTYTLLPGSPRYVFPIPDPEIRISGIEQNPR
jgi:hypothetical protein